MSLDSLFLHLNRDDFIIGILNTYIYRHAIRVGICEQTASYLHASIEAGSDKPDHVFQGHAGLQECYSGGMHYWKPTNENAMKQIGYFHSIFIGTPNEFLTFH